MYVHQSEWCMSVLGSLTELVTQKYRIAGILRGWKLSRIAESRIFAIKTFVNCGNDHDMPIDNDACVVNENFRG